MKKCSYFFLFVLSLSALADTTKSKYEILDDKTTINKSHRLEDTSQPKGVRTRKMMYDKQQRMETNDAEETRTYKSPMETETRKTERKSY